MNKNINLPIMYLLKRLFYILLVGFYSINSYSQTSGDTGPIGPPECQLLIYPEGSVTKSNAAGSFSIQVTTDDPSCGWDVRCNAEWVTVSPVYGEGNGNVTVTYTKNIQAVSRTAFIYIGDKSLSLIQAAGCGLYEPQKSITLSFPINDQDCNIVNGVIQARDYVTLNRSFSYSAATNAPLTIKANADMICPASYVPNPVDGSTRNLNNSLEVGSISGSLNVSASGAAMYNIPILIPQGTGGMQPHINITYNSQLGRSKLGKGFNMGGLSVIQRVPQNHYHDNQVTGLTLGLTDRYVLDGNRLMHVGGAAYGLHNSEYRTEQNTFAKIIAHGTAGTQYFTVQTKDGRTLEYGNTTDSKAIIPGFSTPYALYLNKVTDSNGNYMTYTYEQQDGEIWIKRIDYTGNTGLDPYNSILFYYDERSDVRSRYLVGKQIKEKHLLREIIVKSNDKVIRKYNAIYAIDDLNESYLTEIVESNGSGDQYNSTVINWGDHNLFNISPTTTSVQTTSRADHNEQYFSSCDVNGDGLDELIGYFRYEESWGGPTYRYNGAQIYTAESDENGNVSFIIKPNSFYEMDPDINWDGFTSDNTGPMFGYLLGEGIMDLITPVYSDIGGRLVKFKIHNRYDEMGFPLNDNELPLCTLSDIDNDGRANIIYLEDLNIDGYYRGAVIEIIGDINDHNYEFNELILNLNSEPKRILTGDYNNDGLIDLWVVTGSRIYTYANTDGVLNQQYIKYTSFINNSCSDVRQGDFNGDGLMDLMIVGDNNQTLAVAYGGANYALSMKYFPGIVTTYDPDTDRDDDKNNCIVTDFNNDGLSDFILFHAVCEWDGPSHKDFKRIIAKWYKSTGTGFVKIEEAISTSMEHAYKKLYVSGDFNGDGRTDLINYGFDCYNQSSTTTAWRFYDSFNHNFESNKVKAIYNGLNQKVEIRYRPLSYAKNSDGSDFYQKLTSGIDDVIHIQLPMYVVSSVIQPDGKGGVHTTGYSYEGARIHIKGKGYLGFEKVTASNAVKNIKTVNANELDQTFFTVKQQTSEARTISDQLISHNITDYQIKTYPDNPKRVFNYPVKITNVDHLTQTTTTKEFLSYDDAGNVLSMRERQGNDATVHVQNAYVQAGAWCKSNVSSSIVETTYKAETPYTRSSNFTYYPNGNLNTSQASGVTRAFAYDNYGNITEQTQTASGVPSSTVTYAYDPTKRFVKSKTNALNQTSTFEYDDLGRLISEKGIDGLTTSYIYDNWGKLKTTTYPDGKKSSFSSHWLTDGSNGYYTLEKTDGTPDVKTYFDSFGRKIRTETTGFNGTLYSDIMYNAKGQIEKTISPYYVSEGYTAAHETSYTYDAYGRTGTITSNGLTKSISYNEKTLTETFPSGEVKEKTLDAAGQVTTVTHEGTNISYNYFSNGKTKTVAAPGSEISLTYDDNGFRDILNDPDAGMYNFDYNAIGQLTSKTSPIGNYSAQYDAAGRIISETGNGTISYTYVFSGNGIGQVDKITDGQGEFMDFTYDNLGRVTQITERMGDRSMSLSYGYDSYGRVSAVNYPGNFGLVHVYDETTGQLTEIRTSDNQSVWKLLEVNSHGQMKRYQNGNGLITSLTYDANNVIQDISTGSVQHLSYDFDAAKIRFNSRTGLVTGVTENFGYHTHNQLKTVTSVEKPELNLSMIYDDAVPGRMSSKSDVGTYSYSGINAGPHAVTELSDLAAGLDTETQDITYTTFGKVSVINQGSYRIEFTYGADHQRNLMVVYQDGTVKRKVYYVGNYERHEENGHIIELYYIQAPNGLAAIYKKEDGLGEMYYVHTDHLGSLHVITGQDQQVKARYFYNVWGVKRNLDKTVGNSFQATNDLPWLHRGFTGHEHIPEIGLINMNGRVYDPELGVFISPDPYVQAPDHPINFNRYAYCLNNPLVYTDPDGEFIIEAMIMGAFINTFIQGASGNINSAGDFFLAAGVGALSGAAGGFAGQAVAGAIGTASSFGGAIMNGALVGFSGGFAGGFVGGAGNAWMNGANFGQGLQAGFVGGGYGALGGALIGGISGGIQYQRQISVFQKGLSELGINGGDPVPATDQFLSDAQKNWYKDAPIGKVKDFTVENVPEIHLTGKNGLITNNAPAKTVPLSINKAFSGNSHVYFNKNLAFSSAKQLFFTMGHEFIHVSQFAALAGQPTSLLSQTSFIDLLEFHAYNYQHSLGGLSLNSFTPDVVRSLATQYPTYFNAFAYMNFGWTSTASFMYPF